MLYSFSPSSFCTRDVRRQRSFPAATIQISTINKCVKSKVYIFCKLKFLSKDNNDADNNNDAGGMTIVLQTL